MDSWPRPAIPELGPGGRPVRVRDTSSGEIRPTAPGEEARLYVCGITPYDATHMGHAATYLAFDTLVRAWRDAGHRVRYVQNVTDIDDPLLDRALATGQDWQEIARQETQLFREDMAWLRVVPPDEYIGAVESIPSVVACVEGLRARGAVYDLEGDLYFDVSADPLFGSVSGLSRDEMLALVAERGGDPLRPGKRDPLDPLLWRAARPEEPAWDTPLGHGRPGWHIECVAIALDHLGMTFDVQGGGRDLVFPHHEMGASHAEVLEDERPYARDYVHAGMVGLEGVKMSKSLGNLVFVHRLREAGVTPGAVRLAVLAHHYRDDWDWTETGLSEAQERIERWTRAVSLDAGPAWESVVDAVRAAIADDLDTPVAIRAVDHWVADALTRGGDDVGAPARVRDAVDALLGVDLSVD
ncbi:MAG: cysteine--1-D-myo-inosityl 2-amino-2-deoxy-alpha-D-glucopyranoside ligase [Actinobacteria bacterium]|nr:cysteine--1-D-myo-inosityl 2-amino-2-deoxy-alpha-D-glucopyranoside ligase [Actinomycetota bacterium]